MNIEQIKEKLAHVGLPLHGTDEEVTQRAIANGLIATPESMLKSMVGMVREHEENAATAFNQRADVRAVMEQTQDAVKVIAQAEEKRKAGRPKKGE